MLSTLKMSTPFSRFAAAALLTVVAAAAANAQGTATTQSPTQQSTTPQQSTAKPQLPPPTEIAVSGCLQQRPAVTGAPVGHESGAAAGMILTKASATAARGGAAVPSSKVDSYLIAGTRAQELSRYVDQIVEVAGTLDSDAASLAGRTPAVTDAPAKPAPVHTITVMTFRGTGRSCQ